jgi:putative ABC transport system permease protein
VTLSGLLLANLGRKPARAALTFAALGVAFLLFMLLRAIATAFAGGVTSEGLDRIIVDSKYSLTDNLPLAYVERIRSLEEVDEVTHMTWFAGYVGEPANTFAIHPVEPRSYFDVIKEQRIPAATLARFAETRTGAVASASLARRYGWSTGDVIPLRSDLYPKADGSLHWPLTLLGTFEYAPGEADTPLLLFHYEHYNESVAPWGRNQVYWIAARASSPDQVTAAIDAIDGLFENSPDPTRSTPEDEYRRQFARQLGDIGRITTTILAAVFFTIVLLTGNTALQAYRERTAELAVLKTLGFSDARVALLVLGESILLCLAGAAAGIAAALVLEPGMNANLGTLVGGFEMSLHNAIQALGLAAVLGLLVGLPPAWAARRRSIVDGLREG